MNPGPDAGHRIIPHTADITIEAWGPTRESAIAEAVAAVFETFVSVPSDAEVEETPFALAPASDTELLVALLEEAIYVMDVSGRVPVATRIQPTADGGLAGALSTATPGETFGAVPKAVTRSDLRMSRSDSGWGCTVTLDV